MVSTIDLEYEFFRTEFHNKEYEPYILKGYCWCEVDDKWGVQDYDTFTGRVYIDDKDFELIGSSQYVKFPFKPKTFYIDVVRVPISKEEAEKRELHYIEDGFNECYYTILKDPKQLDKVFKYYDKK